MKNKPLALGGGKVIKRDDVITLYDSKKLSEMTLDELKIIQFEFKSILFDLTEKKSSKVDEMIKMLDDIEMMIICNMI